MRVVVAVGGNALVPRGTRPDAAAQVARIREIAPVLAALTLQHRIVLVHGNGPQVGMLAMESATDPALAEPYPLGDLVAETQGLIGYWLQQAIGNARPAGPVVSLVTQTVVDHADPAFTRPTKFVGLGYAADAAARLASRHGWDVAPDGDRWRRVVASPRPTRIVELPAARTLLDGGSCVVLGGGGGVAVIEGDRGLRPVAAVVDKDHVAGLIAREIAADLLVLLTDVPAVLAGFGTRDQHEVGGVVPAQLRDLDLPAGSMGPKADAACAFVEGGGGRAAIGSLVDTAAVVAGTAGTQVVGGVADHRCGTVGRGP